MRCKKCGYKSCACGFRFKTGEEIAAMTVPRAPLGGDGLRKVAADVLRSALAWEPGARLVGNVTAEDMAALAAWVLTRCEDADAPSPAPGTPETKGTP